MSLGENPYYHLVLLARNYEGYLNLCYMASKAYTEGFHHKPRIDLELLSEKSSGLIGLSSGLKGAIGHHLAQENFNKALEKAKIFEDILGSGNFFLENSRSRSRRRTKASQEFNRAFEKIFNSCSCHKRCSISETFRLESAGNTFMYKRRKNY